MKRIYLFLLICFCSSFAFAQGNYTVTQQQQAKYPAGDAAFQEYFNNNLKYTPEAYEKRVYGSVMVSFNVMPDSTLRDISVLSGIGYGIDEEISSLLSKMKFSPAVANGVLVRSNVIVSITVKAIPK